jgi:DNA (cytosine-5)-methyltransferase 1
MSTRHKWAYYNEIDPTAAAWLRELIKRGLVADGDVDERDIREVKAEDVKGFLQCHWFAGIGGWSYALRLAGWPDDRPVWTGSCPCQPIALGGLNSGAGDSRHLWPVWRPLIAQSRPPVIFGEQVARSAGYSWLDLVGCDLEDESYAFAAADLPGAVLDSLDYRPRLWWVAADTDAGRSGRERVRDSSERPWEVPEFERLVSEARRLALPTGRFGALSDGISGRVGRLRGYGNAIKPQVAAAFVSAYLDVLVGDAECVTTELDASSVSEGTDRHG